MPETASTIREIWFERLDRRWGLPTWAGAIAFGVGPFLLLSVLSFYLAGGILSFVGPSTLLILVVSLFTFYTGRYLRHAITGLLEYANGLVDEAAKGTTDLRLSNFASVRRTATVYLLLVIFLIPLFSLGGTGTAVENLVSEIPFLWFNFILATFFWTFGYSMYSIYMMGKLPLKLKPYTQDRTLGLGPFASVSLNATLIYLSVATSIVIPITAGGAIPFELALLFLGLYPVGLLFFFLPLRSLHSKLLEAKREALARMMPRYERLVETVNSGAKVDQEVANEMAVVDKMQRDIQQVHTWPFETSVIVRLLAILISVFTILLSSLIRDILRF